MYFNSPTFLFLFLPICLVVYYLADRRYRNLVALAASLVFFAWGQIHYLPLMVFLIVVNFFLGKALELVRDDETGPASRLLWLGIVINLALLIFFKLIIGYGAEWLMRLGLAAEQVNWLNTNSLPIGLSYIAFQAIAYLMDVRNEVVDSEKNFLNFALYILFFPKIITGPIARYRDLASQLADRTVTRQGAADGLRRFIIGLAKKALIADTLARVVNPAFSLVEPSFSTGIAWVVVIGYSLQLYYDFSGYTDMAIGLGQMMGFKFVENFNYPYIARSISDFWRRWHISLSSWFRDYVFYPLEFRRRRASKVRQIANMLIVFLLTGLWHGLTINFVVWGMIHGAAIALEMTGFGRWLKKTWRPVQHTYALVIVVLGWVFFRANTSAFALGLIARMFGWQQGIETLPFSMTQPLPLIENSVWLALAAGILFALPVIPWLRKQWHQVQERSAAALVTAAFGYDLLLVFLLVSSVAATVSANLVATIYGGF